MNDGPLTTVNDRELVRSSSRARSSPGGVDSISESGLDLRSAMRAFERAYVLRILSECGFDKPAAAAALGIGLSSLYRKMEDLRISGRSQESTERES